jgi:clan AA aspartic protease
MITGQVTPDREAVVDLRVTGPTGVETQISAVLDTGFTEHLTLPPSTVQALALVFRSSMPMGLADGSTVSIAVYEGTLEWEGQSRQVPIHETDGGPLIGMSLLHGSRVMLDVVDGGQVTIEGLP